MFQVDTRYTLRKQLENIFAGSMKNIETVSSIQNLHLKFLHLEI